MCQLLCSLAMQRQCAATEVHSTSDHCSAMPCCVLPCCPTLLSACPQLEHLKAYHLNQALCSPAVQACARVVARVAHVALSEASKLELDFPQRSDRNATVHVLLNAVQSLEVLAVALPVP